MKMLVWGLLVLLGLVNIFINVSKKYIMTGFGEINLSNFSKFNTWFRLLTNPYVIFILGLNFLMWGVSMWAFSLEEGNNVVVALTGLSIPNLLLTIYFNNRVLGETLTKTQLMGLGTSTVGMFITFVGIWVVCGGVK